MIDAYIDESGIHDGAKVCVIAGYWGGRGQWRKFEKDWRSLLRTFGVPLEKFHATELLPKRGFFFDWDRATHESFLDGVVATITRYKIYPVSFGVIVDDWMTSTRLRKSSAAFSLEQHCRQASWSRAATPASPIFSPFSIA
jgi:hypothetical protein